MSLRLNSEGRLEFPCRYPIKAMTAGGTEVIEAVLQLLRADGFDPDPDKLQVRPSRNGRYQAITIEIEADSRARLEAVHARLRALDGVVMLL
ncbi:MAG: YbeD family protein [Wenzhouxiangellaceae bacterium]